MPTKDHQENNFRKIFNLPPDIYHREEKEKRKKEKNLNKKTISPVFVN